MFDSAKWIWCNNNPQADEYGEFVDFFEYEDGEVILRVSADSNYATYINGKLVTFGQYADFPYDKVYDEVNVTSFCHEGKNRIATIVWYYGVDDTFTYYPGNAALLYEMICDSKVLCESNEDTLSRMSKTYINHREKNISWQLGLGYAYDSTKEDDWLNTDCEGFTSAVIVSQNLPLRSRPCEKLVLHTDTIGVLCKQISETDLIYDLGKEQVGFLSMQFESPCEQEVIVSYGEHLEDGCVRRIITDRDFSMTYRAKKGMNEFQNPFRRFGCRYLEIQSEFPVQVGKLAIIPTMYPVTEKKRPFLSSAQNRIYDMCIETLRLCMHEHYEDCPWREQALYAMDSRNQMLCGYYAFGEYLFPRANLELISKDNREDGLLSICYPSNHPLAIPSFSLHYIMACAEYLKYSWDIDFLKKIYPKLQNIIETFQKQMKDGVVLTFKGKNYWNFYEWRDGLSAEDELDARENKVAKRDLILNALLSIAFQNMAVIADELMVENNYQELSEQLNVQIRKWFYSEKDKVYYDHPEQDTYSQLGNSLAVLCGAAEDDARTLCERILTDSNMTPITVSMQCFKYDALIKTDKAKYTNYIFNDIEKNYKAMVDYGSTTVWELETMDGPADSLCHGWSALPIYYYHILLM